jgi:putative N6-adenine-specific DNA methylase
MRLRGFAQCIPGLEALVVEELRALGIHPDKPTTGGVPFPATARQLYAANLHSRCASRILLRVTKESVRTFAELEELARSIDWSAWVSDGATFRVTATRSRLHHTDAIAQRFTAVTGEGPQLVVLRLDHDHLQVSIDTSGEPLHKRGWRPDVAAAPLRETLAAGAIMAAGWDRTSPLIDPFCGSGTIPIEAATMALVLPPGRLRAFAFESWPSYEPGTWASVEHTARAAADAAPAPPAILGTDRDDGAVATTRSNAELAGVGDVVAVGRATISDLAPPPSARGWLVSNPPWGDRLKSGADLYARIGQVVRERLEGWAVALVVGDPKMAAATGLDLEERLTASAGGAPLHVFVRP